MLVSRAGAKQKFLSGEIAEISVMSLIAEAASLVRRFVDPKHLQIEAGRLLMNRVWIDEKKCAKLMSWRPS